MWAVENQRPIYWLIGYRLVSCTLPIVNKTKTLYRWHWEGNAGVGKHV